MTKQRISFVSLVTTFALVFALLTGCSSTNEQTIDTVSSAPTPAPIPTSTEEVQPTSTDLSNIPEYNGDPYVELDNNQPNITEEDKTRSTLEEYSPLDVLGRCGTAFALVSDETMPDDDRGDISSVKPTGWHSIRYDNVEGKSLYNRCHLIGFQLTGENANEENLITGTRYMNVEGMLPFENQVADYVLATNNHVLYRVTPIFEGDNLVASGVQMEAYSVEDKGNGICFNVYCYNVQPGIIIDYATDDSQLTQAETSTSSKQADYVLNTNSKKFHRPDCDSVSNMSPKNKQDYHGTREDLIAQGYSPCGNCNP